MSRCDAWKSICLWEMECYIKCIMMMAWDGINDGKLIMEFLLYFGESGILHLVYPCLDSTISLVDYIYLLSLVAHLTYSCHSKQGKGNYRGRV